MIVGGLGRGKGCFNMKNVPIVWARLIIALVVMLAGLDLEHRLA